MDAVNSVLETSLFAAEKYLKSCTSEGEAIQLKTFSGEIQFEFYMNYL